ncbi:MAG: EamA family transporter [bacterium]
MTKSITPSPKDSKLGFYLLYTLICLIWGSTWLVIHIGAESGLPPFSGGGLRFCLATILIWAYVLFKKVELPKSWNEFRSVLIVGLLSNGISFGIVYSTSKFIPSGLGAVIFGTMPLLTATISHWAFRSQKLSRTRIIGIIVGILGIATIFYPQFGTLDSEHIWAMLVLLISPTVSAFSAVITKRSTQEVHPIMINAITTSVGAIILGSIALLTEPVGSIAFDLTQVWTIAYLAIIGTIVTFGIYFRLIKETSAVTMSYVAIITPMIAVLVGWFFGHEHLDYYSLAGSVLVVTGVGLSLRM